LRKGIIKYNLILHIDSTDMRKKHTVVGDVEEEYHQIQFNLLAPEFYI
jgi:hypothetical protein